MTFRPLDAEVVRQITRKELAEMADREGLTRAGLLLDFTERPVEVMAREGFDARYGARPLQRALEARVVATLARFLLDRPGLRDAVVSVDVDGEGDVVISTG